MFFFFFFFFFFLSRGKRVRRDLFEFIASRLFLFLKLNAIGIRLNSQEEKIILWSEWQIGTSTRRESLLRARRCLHSSRMRKGRGKRSCKNKSRCRHVWLERLTLSSIYLYIILVSFDFVHAPPCASAIEGFGQFH